jgi:hypothetical protein
LLKKTWNLYRIYWRVFFVFVPLGFLFFSQQPRYSRAFMWNRFADFSFSKFIQNLIGYASTYNGEWWFVRVFVAAIVLGSIYYYLTEKINNVYVETGLVLLLSVFTVSFLPALTKLAPFNSLASSYLWTQLFMPNAFICTYLFGIVFGKYDVFSNLRRFFSGYTALWRAVIGILLLVSAFYFQEKIFGNVSDMMLIITPVFMTGCLLLLDLAKWSRKIFEYFGSLEHKYVADSYLLLLLLLPAYGRGFLVKESSSRLSDFAGHNSFGQPALGYGLLGPGEAGE